MTTSPSVLASVRKFNASVLTTTISLIAKSAADAERDAAIAARNEVEQENKRAQDEYNETVETGKKRVEELNQRFGDWYYVISNDVYKQIHLGRADVIKKKEPAEGSKGAADAEPGTGLPNLPAASEPAAP